MLKYGAAKSQHVVAMTVECSQCGKKVPDGIKRCPDCGTRISLAAPRAETPIPEGMEVIVVEDVSVVETPELTGLLLRSGLLGVLYGGVAGALLMVIAYATGGVTQGTAIIEALLIGMPLGAVSGAIVGMVAALTESVPGGVAGAVIIEGVLRLMVLHTSGLWWGLTPGGVAATLIASVAVGAVISRQVLRSPETPAAE